MMLCIYSLGPKQLKLDLYDSSCFSQMCWVLLSNTGKLVDEGGRASETFCTTGSSLSFFGCSIVIIDPYVVLSVTFLNRIHIFPGDRKNKKCLNKCPTKIIFMSSDFFVLWRHWICHLSCHSDQAFDVCSWIHLEFFSTHCIYSRLNMHRFSQL